MILPSSRTGLTLFPTAIGNCGIAWQGETVLATHLPEPNDSQTRARLCARAGGAEEGPPPPGIRTAIAAICSLLDQGKTDLSFIACDFSLLEAFQVEVYRVTRAIAPGQILTYGEIAQRLGDKRYAQAVGQALGRNPLPIIVPCHRVMGANGKLTGFSANGGVSTKLRMLAIEGAQLGDAPGLFDTLPLATRPAR